MALLGINLTSTKTTICLFDEQFDIIWSREFSTRDYLSLDSFTDELIHSIALFRNQTGRASVDCISITYCPHSIENLAVWMKEVTDTPINKTELGIRLTELFSAPIFISTETKAASYYCWRKFYPNRRSLLLIKLNDLSRIAYLDNGRILQIPGKLRPVCTQVTAQEIIAKCQELDEMFNPKVIVLAGIAWPEDEVAHHKNDLRNSMQSISPELADKIDLRLDYKLFVQSTASPALLAGYREIPNMGPSARAQLNELINCGEKIIRDPVLLQQIDDSCAHIVDCLQQGNKVLTCGNGGSATDAAHLVEELVGKYRNVRKSFPAINLCADTSILTCIANDFGFNNIFSRQIESLGEYGDILVLFSTSGNSDNILRALQAARQKKIFTIAILGKDGGKAVENADLSIIVPSNQTERIQEFHTFILHAMCEAVENFLGSS